MRIKDFDYTMSAQWFVTICTYKRQCVLGHIIEGEMQMNELGRIVEECWLAIPDHFPNVVLGEHVVMPNHIHGVIEVCETNPNTRRGKACLAPTGSKLDNTDVNIAKPGKPIPGSLGIIIGSFKSAVTKRVNDIRGNSDTPFWQRNYFEHGIRSNTSLEQIQKYIKMNPLMWDDDEENPSRQRR